MPRNTFAKIKKNNMLKKSVLCLLVCLLMHNSDAYAWNVSLEDNTFLPESFIAVSKKSKHLYVIEDDKTKAGVDVKEVFPTIYGGVEGDKKREGDKKTPEGVYFVTEKINYQLDFNEYGTGAYALNYPNPIDRIKRKTGSGIWIHSKGQPIEGQVTRGCIAVDLEHFKTVANSLPSGTAVVVASNLIPSKNYSAVNIEEGILVADASSSSTPLLEAGREKTLNEYKALYNSESVAENDELLHDGVLQTNSEAQELINKTKEWNKAWEDMSDDFFKFYDAEKYTLAQGSSYAGFKNQKEYLFERLSWIDIEYDQIYALEGTDYWVTWFNQLYRASNLSSEGIRRLYWQKDKNGEYKVVAMEWIDRDFGMKRALLAQMEEEARATIEEWQTAWYKADVEKYASYYTKDAVQGLRKGKAIFTQKESLWKKAKPTILDFEDIDYKVKGRDVVVTFKQIYKDAKGYSDYGQKNMLLKNIDGKWLIAQEDWRKIK